MASIFTRELLKRDEITNLFDHLKEMSLDRTTDHEIHGLRWDEFYFKKGEFLHDDGWGLSFIIDGEIKSYHTLDPIYECELSEDLLHNIMKSNVLLIHSRFASPGLSKNAEMLHPFIRENKHGKIALAHNGTIKEKEAIRYDNEKYDTKGIDSDSLMLLYSLMTEKDKNPDAKTIEILKNTIKILPQYSGANIMMLTNNELWVTTNFNRFPKYFTFKYLRGSDRIVLSSEDIPYFGQNWKELNNHEIISVRNLDDVNHYFESSVFSI